MFKFFTSFIILFIVAVSAHADFELRIIESQESYDASRRTTSSQISMIAYNTPTCNGVEIFGSFEPFETSKSIGLYTRNKACISHGTIQDYSDISSFELFRTIQQNLSEDGLLEVVINNPNEFISVFYSVD